MNEGTAHRSGDRSGRVWRRVRAGITITVGGIAAVVGVQLGLTAPPVSPVDPTATSTAADAAPAPPATAPDTANQANGRDDGARGRGELVREDARQRGGRR